MPRSKRNVCKEQISGIFLNTLLAMIPGHIYWKNLQGEFLGCNNLQALDAGFENRDDMIGLTDYDMPWREKADYLRKIERQVIKTGKSVITEEKSKTFDGREVVWLSTKEPLRNTKGEIIGIIGVSIDITKYKEKNELLEHLLAAAPGHIYYKNLKSEYVVCNDLQALDAGFEHSVDIAYY